MSRARRNPAALFALAAASLALAACGDDDEAGTAPATTAQSESLTQAEPATGEPGGGEGTGPSDEQQVEAAVETLLTDPDSELVCGEVLTEKLLETAYGERQGCLQARRKPTLADSVRVKALTVDGSTATLVVVPSGGLYGGEKLDVVAVREGGSWRIDELNADIPVGP